MASPQKENGYTAIANEILDALIAGPTIPAEVRRIVDLVIRKTYGFNKREDWIPLIQFALATRLKKQSVIRAVKKALLMNVISRTAYGIGWKYRFNKDFTTWKPLAPRLIVSPTAYAGGSPTATIKRHTSKDIVMGATPRVSMKLRKGDDDGEDLPPIDADTGEVMVQPVKPPSWEGGKGALELLHWAETQKGRIFSNRANQFKLLRTIHAAGWSKDEVKEAWEEVERRGKGVDFWKVASYLDKKP